MSAAAIARECFAQIYKVLVGAVADADAAAAATSSFEDTRSCIIRISYRAGARLGIY